MGYWNASYGLYTIAPAVTIGIKRKVINVLWAFRFEYEDMVMAKTLLASVQRLCYYTVLRVCKDIDRIAIRSAYRRSSTNGST